MIPKKSLAIVDKTFRDGCNIKNLPFAGKLMILGGDSSNSSSCKKWNRI